jgi:hypothetical protein
MAIDSKPDNRPGSDLSDLSSGSVDKYDTLEDRRLLRKLDIKYDASTLIFLKWLTIV